MAIPRMEEDVEIITKLGDVPGSDDGLSAQELKSKFDLAAVRIKNFINNVLLPELNMIVDVDALINGIIDKTLSIGDKAADAKETGDALRMKLDKTGGDISGEIRMGGNKVTGLDDPSADTDATPKKYVDGKHLNPKVTLSAAGWVGDAAPFTQTVSVKDILSTDEPHYGVVYSGDLESKQAQKEAFSLVDDLDTDDGSVTFTCLEDKPVVDILVQMEVNR